MILSEQEKKDWMRLAFSENIGPITFRSLLQYFGTPKRAIAHLGEFAKRGGRTKPIHLASEKQVEHQLQIADELGVQILPSCDPNYPTPLKVIEDAPAIIFTKGFLDVCQKNAIGMVGTRNASLNGKTFTRKVASDLTEADYTIVSGLAKGIDTAAHEGALSNTTGKGGTIAVIGTPLNEIYPYENKELFEEICHRGCVISELAFGSPTSPQNFPRRNRIISGLSQGIIVVEAHAKSGSLITARIAKDQDRHIFAVPGFPLEPRSEGPNKLLKNGAFLVENAMDIRTVVEDLTQQHAFKEPDFDTYFEAPCFTLSDGDLNSARDVILNLLSANSTGIDELIRGTGLSSQLVNIILVELELAGRLERMPGNRVCLLYK